MAEGQHASSAPTIPIPIRPKCVATAASPRFNSRAGVDQEDRLDEGQAGKAENNYFKSAEWSVVLSEHGTADGTCLISTSADNHVRTFVVPPDLLDETARAHTLTPYATIPSSLEPVNAVASYPRFSLQDPSTTLVLASVRDHPVRLSSALSAELVASYPLVKPTTEAFISPHSVLFASDGARFVTGSDNLIAVFDVSRNGEGPLSRLSIGSRKGGAGAEHGMSMRGIVSALALERNSGLLAAGTFSRNVGIYGSGGQGECVGVFCVEGTPADEVIGGRGITQLSWSPCGRYLYISERKSDGVLVYDIRKTGQLLAWLEGRMAMTNQRLGVHVCATSEDGDHEVWAGGTDGFIRAWKDPHSSEGGQKPSFQWLGHDSVVTSAVVHPTGIVVASSSGQRYYRDLEDDNQFDHKHTRSGLSSYILKEPENSLKLWAL